jgi:TonB family protein
MKLLALAVLSASFALGQGHQCPIEAVKVVPHVYTFRRFGPEQNGWRPFNVMAIDMTVRNVSDKNVSVMWFDFYNPTGYSLLAGWYSGAHVALTPGQQGSLYFDDYGKFLNLGPPLFKTVKVILSKIQYANGMIVDLSCDLGTTPIPPPFQPPKAQPDAPVYSVGGDVLPPRVLEWHTPTVAAYLGPFTPAYNATHPNRSKQTMTFSLVVGEDGEPRDIKVTQGTLADNVDAKAKEAMSKWYFAPATKDDKPVAVRVEVSFTVEHSPGGVSCTASWPYGQNN